MLKTNLEIRKEVLHFIRTYGSEEKPLSSSEIAQALNITLGAFNYDIRSLVRDIITQDGQMVAAVDGKGFYVPINRAQAEKEVKRLDARIFGIKDRRDAFRRNAKRLGLL